jgi:hypothetical protein
MMSIHSLRRFFLILAVVFSLAGGTALTPAAEARVRPPARLAVAVHAPEGGGTFGFSLVFLRHVLRGAWEAVGSSMDPLGNH